MEFAGSIGDMGVMLPIATGLIAINGLNPVIVFGLVGIVYISSGIYYKIPMPVQPLKAVGAIAISMGLSASVISASGIVMGIFLLILSTCGLINKLTKLFSKPIIRGIQFGVGLIFVKSALTFIFTPFIKIYETNELIINNDIILNIIAITGGTLIILIYFWKRKFPASIIIIIYGIIISLQFNDMGTDFIHGNSPSLAGFTIPTLLDFKDALFLLVIPQIPLTLGNAVVATKDLSYKYFMNDASRVSEKSLSTGLGIANLFIGFLAGMPVCHGSGGMTAHYIFGARTGGATIMIGSLYLLLGILFLFGFINSDIFKLIPSAILGIMIFYIGVLHASLINDLIDNKFEFLLAISIGLIGFLTSNLVISFIVGILIWYIVKYIKIYKNTKI